MKNIIDIYKVFSLEKIAALNKQNLAMQYETCGQIVALQKQLSVANATSRELLRNQVKELERQEEVRYCKKLIFNINELVEKLEKIDDNDFFYYVCSVLTPPMIFLSNECLNGLEEIQDKCFAKETLVKIENIQKKMLPLKKQYLNSDWHKYEKFKTQDKSQIIHKKIKELELIRIKVEDEIKHIQQELNGLSSIFMSKSKKERYNNEIALKKEYINSIVDDIQSLNHNNLQLTQQFNEVYQTVTLSRPGWEKELEEFSIYLPIPKQPSKKELLDKLFEEAAKLVVKTQSGSTSLIQRKFSLGYIRASNIMNQLEQYGIVGPSNGTSTRKVLVYDLETLKLIIDNIE